MHGQPPRALLRFGSFELDPGSGDLRRDGRVIRLQPQPCRVLVHLASQPGKVVAREALYQLLWPAGTHVDAERGLNFCVKELRKALLDDARAPRFIETLPRRGYRFIARVEAESRPTVPVPTVSALAKEERSAAHRRTAFWITLAASVLVALVTWSVLPRVQSSRVEPPDSPVDRPPEAFLEGRYLVSRGTEEGLERGIEAYRRALEAEPAHAPTWSALAEAHLLRARSARISALEALDEAWRAARRAAELDPAYAPAHLALSKASLYRDFDWSAADAGVERALELDPLFAAAHSHKAFLLAARGRHSEALEEAEIARRLLPEEASILLDLGWYHYLARNYDKALEACENARRLDPTFTPAVDCLESVHAVAGRPELALAVRSERLEPEPGPQAERAWLDSRRAAVGQLEQMARHSRCVAVPLAIEVAQLGDPDTAFDWLEIAFESRSSWLPLVAVEPRLDRLHGDPRWVELLGKLDLQGSSTVAADLPG